MVLRRMSCVGERIEGCRDCVKEGVRGEGGGRVMFLVVIWLLN